MKSDTAVAWAIAIGLGFFLIGISVGSMEHMGVMSLLGGLSDVVVGASAATATVIAWKGLSAWKTELSGKDEYNFSKELITSCLTFRNRLEQLRNPFFPAEEYPFDPDELSSELLPEEKNVKRAQRLAKVYENRWKPVSDSMIDLDTKTIQAESFWHEEGRAAVKALSDIGWDLRFSIQENVQQIARGEQERDKELEKKLYRKYYNREDTIDNQIEACLSTIKSVAKWPPLN